MSQHERCTWNCGSTDCMAPRRIEVARQLQPIAELERKMHKAYRRGFFTQEGLDWAAAKGREMAAYFRAAQEPKHEACGHESCDCRWYCKKEQEPKP
jgi:hypothetical protein